VNINNPAEYTALSNRCLFFACQEVLPYLTKRYLFHPNDHIMHEELILYIQDRLFAQNFRRISLYENDKNTLFKTYIQRIIHHLAIDFLRKRCRETEVIDSNLEIELPENEHLDQRINDLENEAFNSEESLLWIKNLLQEQTPTQTDSVQQRIAEHLNLEISERLFLKAIYFAGLSAEQAGELPGLDMNKNQANSLHRRLLERLGDAFKQSGLYDELQQLVIETDALQAVCIGDLSVRIAFEQLILLSKTSDSSQCQVEYRYQVVGGHIANPYSLLRKRFYNHMLDIRNDAMAGESYLQSIDNKGQYLKLHLLETAQEVQPRYRKKIKQFFATQFTK